MEPADRARALKALQQDLGLYTRSLLRIKTKDAQVIPFELNWAQRYVDARLEAQRERDGRVRAITLKARQLGLSTYFAARFFRDINFLPNIQSLIVADDLQRGGKLFEIVDRFDTFLPPDLRPMRRSVRQSKRLWYANPDRSQAGRDPGLDSQIEVLTADDANVGRAYTIHRLHASEVAFWSNPEESFLSLNQAVPDAGSEIVLESTANGVGNYFHAVWEEAESGSNWYDAIFLPWFIDPAYRVRVSAENIEEIRSTLDDFEREVLDRGVWWDNAYHPLDFEQLMWRRVTCASKMSGDWRRFDQEYPWSPRVAFIVSGGAFFDTDALMDFEKNTRPPQFRANLTGAYASPEVQRDDRGRLWVWEPPRNDGHYVIFADTAEGKMVSAGRGSFSDPDAERGGRDFCSADVFEVHSRKQVAQLHARMAPEVFAEGIMRLGHFYRCGGRSTPLTGIERNHSSGQTVISWLRDHNYENLYYEREFNRRTSRAKRSIGWRTTGETRPKMMDDLAAAIRNGEITIPSERTIGEMFTFVLADDGRPEAQEGRHDDRVISLAGCLQIAPYHNCATGSLPTLYEPELTPTGM